MKTMRIAPLAAAIAGAAAVGLASPAAADLTDGAYTANYDIAGSHPWFVTSCGAGCKSIQWDNGTRSGTDTYQLSGNTWTAPGSPGSAISVRTIDNNTLAGANEIDFMGQKKFERFQLVKNG